MTPTSSDPSTETPRRGVIAGAIALAAHAVVVFAGLMAPRVVDLPEEGMADLAAVVVTVLGGEIIVALTCVVVGAVQFRRGWRYTGAGLMVGWFVGFLALVVLHCG